MDFHRQWLRRNKMAVLLPDEFLASTPVTLSHLTVSRDKCATPLPLRRILHRHCSGVEMAAFLAPDLVASTGFAGATPGGRSRERPPGCQMSFLLYGNPDDKRKAVRLAKAGNVIPARPHGQR